MDVDFTPYSRLDRYEATKGLYYLVEAVRKDLADQGRGKLVVQKTNDRINRAYNLDNASSFKRGTTIGKKLVLGEELAKNDSTSSPTDLAKSIVYFLRDEGLHDWPNVRSMVRNMGKPFSDLADIGPLDPKSRAAKVAREEVRRVGEGGASIADDLRRIAEMVQPIEAENQNLKNKVTLQQSTITRYANENTRLVTAIESFKEKRVKLEEKIADEDDPKRKSAMVQMLEFFNKEFEKIVE